jgi:hypothetical protein
LAAHDFDERLVSFVMEAEVILLAVALLALGSLIPYTHDIVPR